MIRLPAPQIDFRRQISDLKASLKSAIQNLKSEIPIKRTQDEHSPWVFLVPLPHRLDQ